MSKPIRVLKNGDFCLADKCLNYTTHYSQRCSDHRTFLCARCGRKVVWSEPPTQWKPQCPKCRKHRKRLEGSLDEY